MTPAAASGDAAGDDLRGINTSSAGTAIRNDAGACGQRLNRGWYSLTDFSYLKTASSMDYDGFRIARQYPLQGTSARNHHVGSSLPGHQTCADCPTRSVTALLLYRQQNGRDFPDLHD